MGNHLLKYRKGILQRHGVDDQLGLEVFNLLHRGETLGIVEETHPLGIYLIHGTVVLEGEHVCEKDAHLAGTQNKYAHGYKR